MTDVCRGDMKGENGITGTLVKGEILKNKRGMHFGIKGVHEGNGKKIKHEIPHFKAVLMKKSGGGVMGHGREFMPGKIES